MEEQTFVRWVELPEAQPVRFGDLPGLIARALHEDEFAQAAAEINLEAELKALVESSELMVRDPLTLGRHTFPLGAALRRAVLLPYEDLRPLLAARGIGLRLIPYGTGPTHWTIENAAAAIAEQEGWHQGARDTLRGQMEQAAADSVLTLRHPYTGMAYQPARVKGFRDLVTPADVNAWLARDPALSLRWLESAAHAAASDTKEPLPFAEEPPPPEDHSALATRQQLIAAFGTFTGMCMAWFDNVTDKPALSRARKVKGRGQKSRTVEPLFCPAEVMYWLMDKDRKKGSPFHSAGKPWELLQRHFPEAYAKHSVNDPREQGPG